MTPERGRRSVDSDSATTRLPTSIAMVIPPTFVFVLREDSSLWTSPGLMDTGEIQYIDMTIVTPRTYA